MEKINNTLPNWIADQGSLDAKLVIESDTNDLDETYWRMLSICCPLIFEKYAIVLHPFGFNQKIKNLFEAGQKVFEDPLNDPETNRISWADFFKSYDQEFNFKNSYSVQDKIIKEILKNTWPPYVWSPAEGNLDNEEFCEIFTKIKKIYNDQLVNYFYSLLKTKGWENDIIYKGLVTDFDKLIDQTEIKDNPTIVYPDTQEWCIVSDFDLPFTFIGGSDDLIDSITNNTQYEIFQLVPKYNVRRK